MLKKADVSTDPTAAFAAQIDLNTPNPSPSPSLTAAAITASTISATAAKKVR